MLEILIAIALVVVMVAVYQVVLNSSVFARTTKNKDVALKVASHKMEELRALGYTGLPVSGSFTDSLLSSLPSGTAALAISDFNAGLKEATVTVTWNEPGKGTMSVVLDTLIGKTGGL